MTEYRVHEVNGKFYPQHRTRRRQKWRYFWKPLVPLVVFPTYVKLETDSLKEAWDVIERAKLEEHAETHPVIRNHYEEGRA